MEIVVNCITGLFELQLWLIFVQPFRIIQYIFKLFRQDAAAKIVGYIAYPACYIILALESVRETFGDDEILSTVPEALGLRAYYHTKGPDHEIMYNNNPLSNGLTAHGYCAKGLYDQAKKIYLRSLCLFSWLLLTTQISSKKKDVAKYKSTIDQLYNEKKYSELVAFYEGNPKKQQMASILHVEKYIYSLWYSGKTKKALEIASENKISETDNRFDELFARYYESKGDLQKALQYFRSAKLEDETKRILDIIDEQERVIVFEMEKQYNNKEYAKVIDTFEKNNHLANRYNGEEIVSQYIYSIHATAGISGTLVSAIQRYSKNTNKVWERWLGEYYESQGEFLKAAEHYKLADMMDDYKRMLDKEEERKRIEEEKRIAREKQAANEMVKKGEFIAAANKYQSLGMMQEYDRCIQQATDQAKDKETKGLYAEAASLFKALNLTSDYERTNKKDHDDKIAKLKEKIKNDRKNEAFDAVIKDVEANKELLEDVEIVNCYLWSLWLHDGTEDKVVELIGKYAQRFNTTRWESILGHYYAWKKNYAEAIKHYRIAGMEDEIKKMEDKIREQEEEERRRKEEEERRKKEEAEKAEAIKKMNECLKDAIEGLDEDECDRALEYAKKAGADDYEFRSMIENLKNGISAFNYKDFSNAKRYFNRAGLTHWDSQLDELIEASNNGYSSYGSSSGCSECSNACAGSCGRSCSNGCGGSCTSSCGGACSVGRNKRK